MLMRKLESNAAKAAEALRKRGCVGCDRTPFFTNAPPFCQTTPSPHTEVYYSINAMIAIYKYTLF